MPKQHLPHLLVSLIELQQPKLVEKIAKQILLELPGYPERLAAEFPADEDLIAILWSLIQIEDVAPTLLPVLSSLK